MKIIDSKTVISTTEILDGQAALLIIFALLRSLTGLITMRD
jgi:hypothetical protein